MILLTNFSIVMKKSIHFRAGSPIFATLLFSMFILAGSCTKDSNNPNTNTNTGNPNEVIMQGMSFTPSSITVPVGTKVTWRNNDTVAHTVTSDNGLFDSGNIGASGSYSFTFSAKGTYAYHCNIHSGMTGVVVVN
jgi:plastocyanin